jgi:hypothetical protein
MAQSALDAATAARTTEGWGESCASEVRSQISPDDVRVLLMRSSTESATLKKLKYHPARWQCGGIVLRRFLVPQRNADAGRAAPAVAIAHPAPPGAGSGSVFASGRPQGQVRRGCGPRRLVDRGKFLVTACMRLISSRRRHAGSAQQRSSKGWPGSSRAWVLGQASPVDVDQSKVL